MKKKKYVFIVFGLLLAAIIAVRIWSVNKDRKKITVETYSIGEEVAIGNNIFYDAVEDMSDYTVTLKEAELMSYGEFLEKYQYEEDPENPLFKEGIDDLVFPEMVYDLALIVRNINTEEREEVGMDLIPYMLILDDQILQQNDRLYEVANPTIPDGIRQFRLRPGTEMEIHLPCYFQPSGKTSPISVEDVQDGNPRLVVSLYPVRKEIRITE